VAHSFGFVHPVWGNRSANGLLILNELAGFGEWRYTDRGANRRI